ncbi:MAG: choline BCCT transporter BetT [Lautropia sp.]|nr:choline BCCT transporter BetT [Lautropia sp.]
MQSTPSTPTSNGNSPPITIHWAVFSVSAIVTVALIAFTLLFPAASEAVLGHALQWVSDRFGWYYMLVVAAYGIFALFVGFSSYGNIKLGQDHDKPDFPYLAWAAMLFSAGIGIDLLFFGVSEPLTHYLTPPVGEGGTPLAARAALAQTFLHWGLHGWGIYALIGMALAYFAYRHNLPLALRSALVPVFGQKRADGWLGHTVDIFGVVGTLLGLATSLGIGVLQANAGLSHVFGMPDSKFTQAAIIILVTIVAAMSAMSGVEKGVRRLSEINMITATLLLIALLCAGPTQFLFNALVQNIGDYFQTLVGKTLDVYAYEGEKAATWKSTWTIFFWAWWVAWAPFVGLFIARISRGRTLREFVFGVMFIPLGFIFAWFSIFGNSAIAVATADPSLAQSAIDTPAMGLFVLFEHYAWPAVWSTTAVVIGLIFFVTSADSGALVLANLSSRGLGSGEDAPVWLRLFWAAATGLITLGLLFSGGFSALQSVAVAAGLPFSLVLIIYMVAMGYSLKQEGNRRKASTIDFAPALQPGHNWRNRLQRILSFPPRDEVTSFMQNTLPPAMRELGNSLRAQGVESKVAYDDTEHIATFEVLHGEEVDFLYQVRLVSALTPVFALEQATNLDSDEEHERYWRAEVFLREGSQEYDLVGYSKEQIIGDILNQYERHMQFLHLER